MPQVCDSQVALLGSSSPLYPLRTPVPTVAASRTVLTATAPVVRTVATAPPARRGPPADTAAERRAVSPSVQSDIRVDDMLRRLEHCERLGPALRESGKAQTLLEARYYELKERFEDLEARLVQRGPVADSTQLAGSSSDVDVLREEVQRAVSLSLTARTSAFAEELKELRASLAKEAETRRNALAELEEGLARAIEASEAASASAAGKTSAEQLVPAQTYGKLAEWKLQISESQNTLRQRLAAMESRQDDRVGDLARKFATVETALAGGTEEVRVLRAAQALQAAKVEQLSTNGQLLNEASAVQAQDLGAFRIANADHKRELDAAKEIIKENSAREAALAARVERIEQAFREDLDMLKESVAKEGSSARASLETGLEQLGKTVDRQAVRLDDLISRQAADFETLQGHNAQHLCAYTKEIRSVKKVMAERLDQAESDLCVLSEKHETTKETLRQLRSRLDELCEGQVSEGQARDVLCAALGKCATRLEAIESSQGNHAAEIDALRASHQNGLTAMNDAARSLEEGLREACCRLTASEEFNAGLTEQEALLQEDVGHLKVSVGEVARAQVKPIQELTAAQGRLAQELQSIKEAFVQHRHGRQADAGGGPIVSPTSAQPLSPEGEQDVPVGSDDSALLASTAGVFWRLSRLGEAARDKREQASPIPRARGLASSVLSPASSLTTGIQESAARGEDASNRLPAWQKDNN